MTNTETPQEVIANRLIERMTAPDVPVFCFESLTAWAITDAILDALHAAGYEVGRFEQYGAAWHHRWTGELEPVDDDGVNRLYRRLDQEENTP